MSRFDWYGPVVAVTTKRGIPASAWRRTVKPVVHDVAAVEPVAAGDLVSAPRVDRVDLLLLAVIGSGRGFGYLEQASGLTRRQVTDRFTRLGRTIGPVVRCEGHELRLTLAGAKLLWAATNFVTALDAATTRMAGSGSGSRAVVSLCPADVDLGHLLDRAHPAVSAPLVEVLYLDQRGSRFAVASGQADVALTTRLVATRNAGADDDLAADGALRHREVLREPLVLSVPVDHPLAGRHGVAEAEVGAIDDLVSGLEPDAAAATGWWRGSAARGRVPVATSPSLGRQLAMRERRPYVSWPAGAAASRPGWCCVPIASALRRTVSLVSDADAVDAGAYDAVARHVQDSHRAHATTLGAAIAAQCAYPAPAGGCDKGGADDRHLPAAAAPSRRGERGRGPLLDIDDYCLLLAIRDAGSINKAACVLASSQSVVSRRVQQLEAELGRTLVSRSSTGARLVRSVECMVREVEVHAQRLAGALAEVAGRDAVNAVSAVSAVNAVNARREVAPRDVPA